MLSSVGRRRQHDARTASALLDAAEDLLEEDGIDALSVRTVAARTGTSTRAVYSVFGSKEQMLAALGVRAFEMLGTGVAEFPATEDPAADLVTVAMTVFRRFALEHRALFHIAMQHTPVESDLAGEVRGAASDSLVLLAARMQRLKDAGRLGRHSVATAMWAFQALCEGLAVAELRCTLPLEQAERLWRDALGSLVVGFAQDPPPAARTPPRPASRHRSGTA